MSYWILILVIAGHEARVDWYPSKFDCDTFGRDMVLAAADDGTAAKYYCKQEVR